MLNGSKPCDVGCQYQFQDHGGDCRVAPGSKNVPRTRLIAGRRLSRSDGTIGTLHIGEDRCWLVEWDCGTKSSWFAEDTMESHFTDLVVRHHGWPTPWRYLDAPPLDPGSGNIPTSGRLLSEPPVAVNPESAHGVGAWESTQETLAKLAAENAGLRVEAQRNALSRDAFRNDLRGYRDTAIERIEALEAEVKFWKREAARTPPGKRLVEARGAAERATKS